MIRKQVSSSNLHDVGYDPASQILEIGFLSGGVYQYYGVPETIHSLLLAAPSKGTFHHQFIRSRFQYRKIA
jgi:hypothetical protein